MRFLDRFRKSLPAPASSQVVPGRNEIVPVVLDAPSMARAESLAGRLLAKRHLCADLWTVYAGVSTGPKNYLSEDARGDIALAEDALHALALENLEETLPGVERHGDGGAELLTCGGGFEPSLLLFAETWDAIAEEISGDVVACVPSRDRVIFTGSAVPGGVERVRVAAEKILQTHAEPVSGTLLRWTGERWVAWPSS